LKLLGIFGVVLQSVAARASLRLSAPPSPFVFVHPPTRC
jgi:hypothetical protein